MLQAVFLAGNRHIENELSNPVKKFVKGRPVVPKAIAHKRDKISVFYFFMFLFEKHFQNLLVTRFLNLSKKCNAFLECSFLDERVSQNILCFAVNSVQIVTRFLINNDIFFIIMNPPFYYWSDLLA